MVRPGEPVVFALGRPGAPADAFVRVGRSPSAIAGLVGAEAALTSLGSMPAPNAAALLPRSLGSGVVGPLHWLAETAASGEPGTDRLMDPNARRHAVAAVIRAIEPVHATALETVIGDDLAQRWIDDRIAVARAALGSSPAGSTVAGLDRLQGTLRGRLTGARVRVGWIHGDLWLPNVLFDPSGEDVTGLVDWDSASSREAPLQDRLHLALTTRRRAERRQLGPVVAELLMNRRWTEDDRLALGLDEPDRSWDAPAEALDGLDATTAIWLYWLRFVETNLARHPELGSDRAWLAENVARVVACL